MTNDEIANKYLKWINDNYDSQKSKLLAFCHDKNYKFDEDIFCDTYLKIYEKIKKNGMEDCSDSGFDNYTFMAFKINLKREEQYSRNQKKDSNVTNVSELYEEWYNSNSKTCSQKLISDLRKDFYTLYLLSKAEENFDSEHFYLFRLKTFTNMTYAKLSEHTGIKGCRQKVVDVKNWLKQNVSKAEVDKAFEETYGNIFEF